MYKLNLILFSCFLFWFSSTKGQDLSSTLQGILEKNYPDKTGPGAVIYVLEGQKVSSASTGLASLKSKENIDIHMPFRMASVSKQFTAFAIYQLANNQKLNLNQRIDYYFPTLNSNVGAITIKQLLNHCSGIADYENLMGDKWTVQLTDADVLKIIEPVTETYFPIGSKFRYSNTAYCLLALIIEKVSNQSYPSYMQQHVFQYLGMKNSLIMSKERVANPRAYGYHPDKGKFIFADQSLTSGTMGDGGVYTTASDYAIWLGHLSKLLSNPLGQDFYFWNANRFPINLNVSYSFGWFIGKDKAGEDILFHSGESTGFHNIVVFYPIKGKSVSMFSNRDDLLIAGVFDEVMEALDIEIEGLENEKLFHWLGKVYANKL